MIVLDTNVVSELVKPTGDANVRAWASAQPRNELFIGSPAMAELRFGIVRLPAGKRKTALLSGYDKLREAFRSNIVVFDLRAAESFADILLSRQQAGAPIQVIDAQIAAIARARNAAVATRDVSDFQGCGVTIVGPWSYEG